MVLIAFIVWAQVAQLAPVKVSSPREVMEIRKLNGFVTAFSKSVTACVDAGSPIGTCRCRYPQEALNLRKGCSDFINRHPDWKDRMLSYEYVDDGGRTMSGAISIPTLRRQLDGLKCEY